MTKTIRAKNKNGVISHFTEKEWEDVQKNPLFEGVFTKITTIIPPEVKELEAKKAEKEQPKKGTSKAKAEEVKK